MELKRNSCSAASIYSSLLIVPYGIETRPRAACRCVRFWLLIVPYGIETTQWSYTLILIQRPFNCTLWN